VLQTSAVVCLQLGVAALCLGYGPDADRVVSLFTGMQFFLEALSTLASLISSLAAHEPPAQRWQAAAFVFSLLAIGVPILLVVEMRLLTPLVMLARSRECHALSLCAALYMLAVGLRKGVQKMMMTLAGFETDVGGAGPRGAGDAPSGEGAAEAGAGNGIDAAHGQSDGANATLASDSHGVEAVAQQSRVVDPGRGGGMDEDDPGDAGTATDGILGAADVAEVAMLKASGLAARAAAAKEVDVKRLEISSKKTKPDAEIEADGELDADDGGGDDG